MIADIKFNCTECGQPIAVDSAAAGLAAHCPTCRNEFVVPAICGINDRDYGSAPRKLRRDGLSTDPGLWPEMAFRDLEQVEPCRKEPPTLDFTLAVAFETEREEVSSLRQQVATSREECEHWYASATHSQAELKSFQADRLAQKTELAHTRQRLLAAEECLAEREEELAARESATRQLQAECANLQSDLLIAKQRTTATETQLEVKEREATDLHEELHAQRMSEKVASREVESLKAESALLRREVDVTRAELVAATREREQLAATESALREMQQKFCIAEKTSKALALKCEILKHQATSLQRDLRETKMGRTLIELRSQVANAEEERQRLHTELHQVSDESAKREESYRSLDLLLKQTRRQLEEAVRIAEASSESRILHDNEILRGIITRQNAELEARHADIMRYKRARLGVRVLYAVFAIVMAGVTAALLRALPLLGI